MPTNEDYFAGKVEAGQERSIARLSSRFIISKECCCRPWSVLFLFPLLIGRKSGRRLRVFVLLSLLFLMSFIFRYFFQCRSSFAQEPLYVCSNARQMLAAGRLAYK